jgi:spore maturation protein CgeB
VVLPGNITIEHPVPFGRVSELMQQSRVVLNCSPSHAGGAHERIFDAVMCGAAVVTTPSSYVSRLFSGESAVRAGASANEAVHEFMNQPERTNRQVGLSQQIVCQNHRFGNRVDELLKAFEYRS